MSALPKPRKLTAAEYLLIERHATGKSEFYHGELFAMAGASPQHNAIKENLIVELGVRLRGTGCRTASSDQRVRVPTGLYTYPDVVVFCGRPEYDPLDQMTLTNPTVLIEVLSPSTAEYDRGVKLDQYQHVNGLAEVVLVSQELVWAEVHARRPDGRWVETVYDDPAGELVLPSLGVRIPLADVYRDVFPPAGPA
jgi:Uma2 family endonuclease